MWLRGEESNLYFLVQSQASCRLDDPEKKGESSSSGSRSGSLKEYKSLSLLPLDTDEPLEKIGEDGRT